MTSPNPWALPSWVGEPRKSGILQRSIPHSLKVARDSSKTQELLESQAFPTDSNKYDAVGEHAATCVNRSSDASFCFPGQIKEAKSTAKENKPDRAKPQGTCEASLARQGRGTQNNACAQQTNAPFLCKENLSEHKVQLHKNSDFWTTLCRYCSNATYSSLCRKTSAWISQASKDQCDLINLWRTHLIESLDFFSKSFRLYLVHLQLCNGPAGEDQASDPLVKHKPETSDARKHH